MIKLYIKKKNKARYLGGRDRQFSYEFEVNLGYRVSPRPAKATSESPSLPPLTHTYKINK